MKKLFSQMAMAVLLFVCSAGLVAGFAAVQPLFEPDSFERADMIVVLGAGMDPDGRLHRPSKLRVEKGAALFAAGAAPRIHFTGGRADPSGPSAGGQMSRLAQSLGVPASAISHEDRSLSTLQNALFSQPMLTGANRIIVVTEGFHLPRSWLSFKWAGDHEIALSRSTSFRTDPSSGFMSQSTMIMREALAWWFNLARMAGWEIAGLFDIDRAKRDAFLD